MFFLTTELVDDAFCTQLHVIVDMRKDPSRQTSKCMGDVVALNDRCVVAVDIYITSSTTTDVYILGKELFPVSCQRVCWVS